jgi:hypothetical protein
MPDHEWIVSDMRSLALGRRFDGILAWDSFFHLSHKDQRTMFSIFAMHAAPASILMFNAGFGRGEAVGSYRGDPLHHASLDASEYKALLADSGFEFIEHSINDPAKGGRIFWLARAVQACGTSNSGSAMSQPIGTGSTLAEKSQTQKDKSPASTVQVPFR